MVEKPAQAIDDSEAQSHPAPPLMLGAGELMKLREDVLVLILRNAVPAVPHLDAQLRAAPAAANHDPALPTALDPRFSRIRSSRMGSLRTQALFDTIRNESPFLRAVAAKVLSVRLSRCV